MMHDRKYICVSWCLPGKWKIQSNLFHFDIYYSMGLDWVKFKIDLRCEDRDILRVTKWHENNLEVKSLTNTKMNFHKVQLKGLSEQPHVVLQNITTTQKTKKLWIHLKFLTNDFPTNERLSLDQPHISPACVLCRAPLESTVHVFVKHVLV